jgi:hypothetical protein
LSQQIRKTVHGLDSATMMRWRTYTDRLIVLAVILAA